MEKLSTFAMYEVGDTVLIDYGEGQLIDIIWRLADHPLHAKPLFAIDVGGHAWFRDPKHVRPGHWAREK